MHKIITSDFEIDLTGYNISMQEENSWFSDTFFTKYSYPFDLIITDEINRSLGDILSYDSKSGIYYLSCQYVFYNTIENAVLIVEQIVRNVASVSLKYGMDEFPNFDKNLSELDLEVKTVSNIYNEANNTVTKSYPLTNYNFPQIHTDKFDPTNAEFHGFQKIINNRRFGVFLENTVEEIEGDDVMYNRNIIQPLPYLMYILKKGFQLSGLTLVGDIIHDNLLKNILIFSEKEPKQKDVDPLALTMYADEVELNSSNILAKHELVKTIEITQPGKYNIIGSGTLFSYQMFDMVSLMIFKDDWMVGSAFFSSMSPKEAFGDLFFTSYQEQCTIKIVVQTAVNPDSAPVLFDFQILPVYFIGPDGRKLTNLLNDNKIDLNRCVPNMTFGALVTATLNMFNYDVDSVTPTEITINKINTSLSGNKIYDLSKFDNVDVIRKPHSDTSMLIKYAEEGDIDLGGFYIDKNESKIVTKEFTKETSNTIEIPIYPLQNELIDDVFTAKSVQSSDDKLCFVIYEGLIQGNNYTMQPTALSVSNLIYEYHYEWLNNRVHSMPFNISFIASALDVVYLTSKNRVFCYNNIHIIKNITKNQLPNEMFEVELETETLVEM